MKALRAVINLGWVALLYVLPADHAIVWWLDDRGRALGAARRSAVSQYRQALRNLQRNREAETPAAKRARELRNAQTDEADARERLLRLHRQWQERAWAAGRERQAAVVIAVGWALFVGGWVSFWVVFGADGASTVTGGGKLLAFVWLTAPIVAGLGGTAWGTRTGRVAREAAGRADVRDDAMASYDRVWHRLAVAERAAGQPGIAMVVAPMLFARRAAETARHRPATELLAIDLPDAIEQDAKRLAEGESVTMRRLVTRMPDGLEETVTRVRALLDDDAREESHA